MPQMTKSQLQAKARAAGVKGYNTMTVAELKKAIAIGAKTTRKTPRPTRKRRGLASEGITKYSLLRGMQEAIEEGEEYGEDSYDAVMTWIDNQVIYYSDAAEIVMVTGYYTGYQDSEFAPFDNISQLAYAALMELATDEGLL